MQQLVLAHASQAPDPLNPESVIIWINWLEPNLLLKATIEAAHEKR